jgi:hypothetical protein
MRTRSPEQRSADQLEKLKKIFEAKGKPLPHEQALNVQKFLRMLAGIVVENYLSGEYDKQQSEPKKLDIRKNR